MVHFFMLCCFSLKEMNSLFLAQDKEVDVRRIAHYLKDVLFRASKSQTIKK